MSLTFHLICPQTKQKLWVGQGHHYEETNPPNQPVMDTFYSGEPKTMELLHRFLKATQGKELMLVCDEWRDDIADWEEFT
jgi:hypothetical protein